MVIDTSALMAIIRNEPEASALEGAILAAGTRLMSAATVLETAIVVDRRHGQPGAELLDRWLHLAGVEVVAFDAAQLAVARRARARFGKGRHRAALNYGDCFSYALAQVSGEPLLFVGDDFSQTDVNAAPYRNEVP